MIFSKEIALKVVLSIAAIGGGIAGIHYTTDYYSNLKTSYDRALIDFLRDGGNIAFKVTHKSGETTESDLSENFPDFTDSKKTISVSLKVSTADNGQMGTLTESDAAEKKKATKKSLNDVNGGNDWTWNCQIIFDRGESTLSQLEDDTKEKIFKSPDKGLMGSLKAEGSDDNRAKKIDFIKKCAKHRGWSRNKELNGKEKSENKEISGRPIVIELKESNQKLVFKNRSDMEYWISKT